MQYNKKQFNKVNDKKIMKKVKKQWVVVSVATLAFLGASAFGMVNTTSAHADTTPSETTKATDANASGKSQSDNKGNNQKSGEDKQNQQSGQSQTPQSNTTVATNQQVGNGQTTTNADSQSANNVVKTTNNNSANEDRSNELSNRMGDSASQQNTTVATNQQVGNGQTTTKTDSQSTNKGTETDKKQDSTENNPKPVTVNTQSGSTITNPNKSDESANFAAQVQQGYTDAYQNKGNQSSKLSGQAANYYNASYDGASVAMNAYNKDTQNQGAGTQDYVYYGNTVDKKDGIQKDREHAQTGNNGSNKNQQSHDTTSQSSSASSNSQSNPTDGTPLKVSDNKDEINPGGADNPEDAYNSVEKYRSTLEGRFNNASNVSVQNVPTNGVTVPTAKDNVITTEESKFNSYDGLKKAFAQGVTYALTQQGMADAENGKWQGIYTNSNGQTKDYYLTSHTTDTTSDYDQAYRGARDAMNAYFSSSNSYNGNTSVSTSTDNTKTEAYNQGFNDVVNQAKQGTVYVQNGSQFRSITVGNTYANPGSGNLASGIQTIKLANDVDLSGDINGEQRPTITTTHSSLTIDGQNHMIDLHGNSYYVNNSNGDNSSNNNPFNLYVKNFQSFYGANFYGPFVLQTNDSIHYSNINYVGPQLLSATNNDAYFSGSVNVVVPNTSNTTYTSPFQSNVPLEGGGNQENLEVRNFILEPNSYYFGNTSPVIGGTNIDVAGNVTLGEGSKMTLIPRGYAASSNNNNANYGINMTTDNAQLNVNKNAVLNIIPGPNNNGILGAAVGTGNVVSINVDGGTINYEGYNGQSGTYNQPFYLANSGIKINVINGGILQVLMQKIGTNSTTSNLYNGQEATYNGLIDNVGLGTFNVGSRGNLKIGVVNSSDDKTYEVPYWGPININSVGANHAIFIKHNVTPFQSQGSPEGQGPTGQINAYSVAVEGADNKKTYLYSFTLPSGNSTYSGVDFNGNNVTGQISGDTLDIADIPAVQFVGPLSKQTNGDGSTTVTAYAKLSNYTELNGSPIYVGVASSDNNVSYNSLSPVDNNNITDSYSKADPNTYNTTVSTNGYNGGIIPITYNIPKDKPTTYIGMRLHYGINSVNSILGPHTVQTTVEGYQAGSNGKVQETSDGDMQVANSSLDNFNKGASDALTDSINNTTANKDGESFDTKTSSDYLASYSSVQAGYQAFANATAGQDVTQLSAYINSSNPAAFLKGYKEAAYQAGLSDARFNKQNVSGNSTDAQKLYAEAQQQYNDAYQAALDHPSESSDQIKNDANLPTQNSNGNNASAVDTAINDAQAVAQFIKDEKDGNLNNYQNSSVYQNLTDVQKNAYNDAYNGYQSAMNDEPKDTNADKADSAGYDYAKSLINGANATTNPSDTDAQFGFEAVNKAISDARDNNSKPSSAKDQTAYNDLYSGARDALDGKSEDGLNALQKVGYEKAAYDDGASAFNQGNGRDSMPNGYKNSDAATNNFHQGWDDAKASSDKGRQDGIAAVDQAADKNNVSNQPTSVPSDVKNAEAYKSGYKGGVDGYKDGSLSSQGTDTHKDKNDSSKPYADSYKSAYATGRQVAGGNDYVASKTQKANDDDYVKGFNDAKQGHDDGYNDAKTNNNPQPTKSTATPYVAGYNNGVSDEKADQAVNDGVAKAESENLPNSNNSSETDAYKGAADAINAVHEKGKQEKLPDNSNKGDANYIKAYNQALEKANKAHDDAVNDALGSKNSNEAQEDTNAGKRIYDDAYNNATKGYAEGLNESGNEPGNVDERAGYDEAQKVAQGYKDALDKFTNNKDPKNASESGYQDALNALNDAKDGKAPQNTSAIYNYAYSQQKAVENAIEDGQKGNGNEDHKTAPSNVNASVYSTAYQAAKDGFADGNEKTALPVSSDHKSTTNNNLDYTNSYTQGLRAGRVQRGMDDALNNRADKNVMSNDPDYKAGVEKVQPTGSTEPEGINQAAKSDSNDSGLTGNGKTAYYATKDAYAAVKDSNGAKPSDGQNINTTSSVYQDAYNKAKQQATNDANAGVQAFAGQAAAPTADGTMDGQAKVDGYNDADSGYEAAKDGKTDVTGKNDSYKAGVQMYQAIASGINDAKNGSNVSSGASEQYEQAAKDAAQQAYQDAKSDNPNAKSADPTKDIDKQNSKVYQDAYDQAKQEFAKDTNDGAKSYLNGESKGQGNDEATTAKNDAMDKASQGFSDGQAENASAQQPNNSAYMTGYNAAQAVKAAENDAKTSDNNTDSRGNLADKATYDQAKQDYQAALVDAKAGNFGNTERKDPVYASAYNQAKSDATNAYNNGEQNAKNNPLADSNSYESGNTTIKNVSDNGFNEFKAGFNSAFNGNTISNPTSANNDGNTLGTTAKNYVDNLGSNPDSANGLPKSITDEVSKVQQQAKSDFDKNPDAKTSDYTNDNPFDKYVYQHVLNNLQSDYKQGAQKAATLAGNDKTSDNAYTKGYQDYMAGLKSVITPNAQSAITTPNKAQQDGIDAANNDFQSGYNKAEAKQTFGEKDSAISKAANNGATQAFSDAKTNNFKDDASLSKENVVYQAAYNKAKNEAQNARNVGADKYLKGEAMPDSGTVTGGTEDGGYDAAQQGYSAAKNTPEDQLNSDQKNDAAFMKGYHAYKDAQSGIDAIIGSATKPADDAPQIQKDAYAAAQQAYNDVKNNGSKDTNIDGWSPIKKDAYNKALAQAKTAQQDAIDDIYQGTTTHHPSNANDQGIYDAAKKDIAAGFDAAKNGGSYDQAKYTNDPAYKKGVDDGKDYQAAVNAANSDYQKNPDNLAGKDDSTLNNDAKQKYPGNSLQQQAYVDAVKAADKSYNDGISQFNNGSDEPTDPNGKAGYEAAKAGHDAAMQGETANDSSYASKKTYDDAYNNAKKAVDKAVQDTVANGQANTADSTKFANKADQQAYNDTSKAVSQALADAKDNDFTNTDSKYTTNGNAKNDPASQAYAGAKAGYADGKNGSTTEPTNATAAYKAAYDKANNDAKAAVQAGINEFAKGDSQSSTVSSKDAVSAAHNNAFSQAQAGYNAARQGKSTTGNDDPSYQKGVQMYQAIASGINAAKDNSDVSSDAYKQAAKDAAQQAYQDAKSDNPSAATANPATDTDKQNSKVYQDAYDQAKQEFANDTNAGAKSYLNGADKGSGNDADTTAKNDAMDKASQGFNDGQADKTSAQHPDNSAYMIGYNAAQAVKAAEKDAAKGDNNTDSKASLKDKDSYDNAKTAYQTALSDAKAGNFGNTDSKDKVYASAYNQAKSDATNAYNDGKNQALNKLYAQTAASSSYPNSDLQTLANNGFNDVKNGFDSVINNQTMSTTNEANKAGISLGTTAKNYVDNLGSNSDSADGLPKSITDEVSKVQQQAKSDFDKNPDAKTSDYTNDNPFDKYVYQHVLNNLQSDYKQGAQKAATLAGNDKTSDNAYTKGYQDYMAGLKSVITPNAQSAITTPNKAQQDGIDAANKDFQSGYNEAEAKQASGEKDSAISKAANDGATQAFSDAASNSYKNDTDLAKENVVYQAAYNKAKNEAQNARNVGADKYLNGEAMPDSGTVTGGTEDDGYKAAQQGYSTAKDTSEDQLSPNQKNDAAFMKGYYAYQAAQSGIDAIIGSATKPADNAPQVQKDAYDAAQQAYSDVENKGNQITNIDSWSPIKQDAYKKALTQAKNAQQAAIEDIYQGTTTNRPNANANDQGIYDAAKKDIAAGFNAAKNGGSYDQTKYANDPAYKKGVDDGNAYQAAVNAANSDYQNNPDSLAGKDDSTLNNDAKQKYPGNSLQQQAYVDAVKAADNAYNNGISQFNNGSDEPTDPNGKAGYEAAKAGHDAAMQGETANDSSYASKKTYDDAYNNAKKAVDKAVQDTVANGQANTADSTKFANKADQQAYNDTSKAVSQALADAKNTDFKDNDSKYTTNGNAKNDPASQAYAGAKAGYADGKNGSTTEPTNATAAYKAAYDKANNDAKTAYKDGEQNAQTNPLADSNNHESDNATIQSISNNGFNEFKAGFNSAFNGNTISNPTSANKDGNTLGTTAKNYVDNLESNPDSVKDLPKSITDEVSTVQQQAQDAFNSNPDANADGYSGNNPFDKYVYQHVLKNLQNDYKQGAQKAATLGGNDKTSDNAYTKGYQDYMAGLNSKLNPTKDNQISNPTTAQQAGINAANNDFQSGYNEAEAKQASGEKDSAISKSANDGATQAFNDALNNTNTSLDGKSDVYKAAYNKASEDAQKAIADGQQAAKNKATITDGTSAHDVLAKHAHDQYLNGYKNGTAHGVSNDPSFLAGQTAKTNADKAVDNFKKNPTSDGSDLGATAQQAFDEAVAGNSNSANHTGDNALAKNDVYAQVHKLASDNNEQGIKDYLQGNPRSTGTDVAAKAEQAGYDDAKQGMAAQLDGKANEAGNPAYTAGVNAAKAIQAAEDNAQKANTNKTADDKDSFGKATQGYADAVSALKNDHYNQTQPTDKNAAYTKAYNDAVSRLQSEYTAGAKDLTAGKTSVDANLGQADNDAINDGFADATKAFNAGMNGNDSYEPANKAESDANKSGKAAEQGIQNVINDNKPATGDDNVDKAINDAKTNAAKGDFDAAHASSDIVNNPTLKSVYDKAIGQLHDVYTGAIKAEIAGTSVDGNHIAQLGKTDADQALKAAQANDSNNDSKYPTSDNPQTDADNVYHATRDAYKAVENGDTPLNESQLDQKDPVYATAYNNALAKAKSVYATGASDNQDNSGNYADNKAAQAVYESARNAAQNAYNDALTDNGSHADKYNGNDKVSVAYQAAKNAINDYEQNNGKAKQSPNNAGISSDNTATYSTFYQKALDDIANAAQAGVKAYEDGKNINDISSIENVNKSLGQVAVQAALRAQKGHDDVITNKGNTSEGNEGIKDDPSYQAGLAATKAAVDGEQKAMSDASTSNAPSAMNDANGNAAFNGTVDGYNKAAKDGNISANDIDNYITNNLANKSLAYRDAFKKAYLDGLKQAKSGVDNALSNKPDETAGQKGAAQQAQTLAYNDAKEAYQDALKGTNDTSADANSVSAKAGRDKAKQFMLALSDVNSGHPNTGNTNSNYQLGLRTAGAAMNQAIADAKANKSVPADMNSIKVPDGLDSLAYRDVYAAILNGYTNGYKSGADSTNDKDAYYQLAFKKGYEKGAADIPAPTPAPKPAPAKPSDNGQVLADFSGDHKQVKFANDSEKQSYDKAYQNVHDGFNDGIKGKAKASADANSKYYNDGYQLAVDGSAGMKLAKSTKKAGVRKVLASKDAAFKDGYRGYKLGLAAAKRNAKQHKALSKTDLTGKNRMYAYAYKQAVKVETKKQDNLGEKAANKRARVGQFMAKHLTATHSVAYVRSYIKAFKRTFRRHMPKYVYNVKTIFTHDKTKYSNKTRIEKYAYTKRYNSTVFRVVGVRYTKHGTPRYVLKSGHIVTLTANLNYVNNAYYKHDFKTFHVIKPTGVLVHVSKKFGRGNVVRRITRGQAFKIRKVVKYHGLTRLYIGHGEYVTSNKTYVKFGRK